MRILGIESSCDETAAAVVEDGERVLSSVVASQLDTHGKYGGVVPELASREHLRAIVPTVRLALESGREIPDDASHLVGELACSCSMALRERAMGHPRKRGDEVGERPIRPDVSPLHRPLKA